MNKKTFSYKGYTGSADISIEDNCLFGRILFIEDIISYEGDNPGSLEVEFRAAVDRYLAYCASTGKSANKPYSGTFNVRVGIETHRHACIAAAEYGVNLNEFVCMAIEEKLIQSSSPVIKEVHHHHYQAQNAYNEDVAQPWHDQSPSQARLAH
jgi:predicted HicB family RNase H-like nuclease